MSASLAPAPFRVDSTRRETEDTWTLDLVAEGGELVVTDHVRTAVGDLRGVAFDGPYTRRFKGIEEQVPVYLASRHVCRSADPQTAPAGHRLFDGGCR